MNKLLAIKKISNCIDSATTKEHHVAIERMIENYDNLCQHKWWWDKSLFGAIVLLKWQNVYQYNKKFGGKSEYIIDKENTPRFTELVE
jgi:hypothetical protein